MNQHSDDYIRGVRDCAARANKVMCKECFEKLDKEIAEFRKPPAPEGAHGCIHWSNKSCESDESPCPDSAKCRYFKTAPEGELKPCPFCGGTDIGHDNSDTHPYEWLMCEDCGAKMHGRIGTGKVFEKWNRREE